MADILVDSSTGEIVEIGDGLSGDQTLDAQGCCVSPGFVDMHAHLREPGGEAAETIETGSRTAALGGYTAVVAMPNTNPTIDSASVVADVLALAKDALCHIAPSAAITVGRDGNELTGIGELYDAGVRLFTDGGTGVQDASTMRTALEYAKGIAAAGDSDILFAQHCEVSGLSAGGVMNEGEWSTKLGLGGQPAEAEELMVARDIALSRLTGMPIHMMNVSTAGSVELVRQAKAQEIKVTADACPHHFTLTDEACKDYDATFKVDPPLRTDADVAAIIEGLADGTIDVIATDHAPHESHTKQMPFDQAPPGMIGLETAFGLANTQLGLDPVEIVDLMSIRPAELAGLSERHGRPVVAGEPANLTVFDPAKKWTVDGANTASRSSNCPFDQMELTGKVRHTIFEGEAVVIEGEAQR